ncbi:MAG: FG-GAP-like repeat-containing protein, partial [Prevotella sp.]|nr:FG-GAP-like repeat-containing protein [Prevotella sp.]
MRKNFYIKFSFVIALSCVFGVSQAYCIDSTKPSEANADILIKGRVDISNTIQGDSVDPKKQNPITTMVSSMPISDLPEDPGLPLNPDDPETPTDPTPFDPIDSDPEPLPQESVGTPHGSFSVSNSGSAVYDLKIDVPNGGSFTPQLSISYNSQSGGYGLAGFGFNIAGISAITRGGKDLFHDGQVKGTTYTGGDTYFLDGKRLILQSGTAGQNGAIYTVEGDPFTKVVVYGNYSNSTADTWFEVRSSDGTVYQYGNSTTSKLSYRNKTGYARIASWYINRATDKYSNYITYDYAIGTFFIRPISITYGTNLVKGRGIVNKISFSYQSLGNNTRPFAVEDQHGLIDVCLSSVTATCNNSIYRKYTFSYNDNSDQSSSKWTRLVTVEEANGTGEKLPPVRFTWQYLPSLGVNSSQLAVSTKDGSSFVEETSKQFLSADLNGDGISDIIRVSPVKVTTSVWAGGGSWNYYTYVYVSRSKVSSTGSITYDSPLIYTLPSGISMDVIKSMFGGAAVMDFDGDGYNDLVFPFQNAATGYWDQAVFYIVLGSDVVAGRSGGTHAFAVGLQSTDKAPLFVTFDVDGNGKDDVVCVEQRKKDNYYPCTIVQFTGGTTLNRTEVKLTLPQEVSKDIEKVFVGDYNNDGLSDLILLYDGGYKVYFNNGGAGTASAFTESNAKSGTDFGNYWRIQQGDFDGDGLLDFVYNKAGETCLWIAHNNGNGTFTHTKSVDIGVGDHASNKDDGRFSLMAYDMDHDGRTDVMVCKAGYRHRGFPKFENEYTDTQVKWLYSTGSNLKLGNSYTKNREDDADERSIFLGDFNGDGNIELANYGSILNSTNSTFYEKINIYKSGYDLSQIGKITSISDGMGNSSYIQYASATSPAVYRKSFKNIYPVNTYTLPLSVVARVTSDNGSLGSQVTKYFYEDLRLHIAGKGMLGFNTVTSENTTLDTKEVNSVTKWDESLWIPTEIKTSSSVSNNSSTIISTYSVSKTGNNYFAYVSQKDVADLDGNKVTTVSNYDVSKGVIVDETVKNDGDNMYKKVSYTGYQNKAGVWLPTTLTMSQKHANDPAPYTTVTTYGYDDKGNVLSSTVNSGTNMALKTTSTYDVYGNTLSSVTTGSGVKTITKYNDYDPSGRFVIKSYTNPASAINTFTYDLWGNVLTESDVTEPSNILTTKYTYDGWGRKLTALLADSTRTTYETGWGITNGKKYYTKESTTGKPSVTTWYDNGGHEVLQETLGAKGMPVSKTTTYNSKGQFSRVENKTGKLTITQDLTYDERGRVITDVLSSGKSASYSYGNRSVTTTIAGRSYTKTTDAWGNVVKSTDPVSEVEYQYSSIGKPSSVKTQGSTVTMSYDAAGNQLSLSDPDAGTSNYTYAADGTLLTQTDGRGIKTINNYDDLGRLASTQIGQKTIVYTYGTTGNEKLRLVKLASDNNSVEYTHDRFGRVVTEKRNVDGHGDYSFSYAYNSNNQLSKTTYPGGLEESYLYDNWGFKAQTTIGDKVIYKVESTDGLVSSTSFMGKLTATQTRDARGYESNCRITRGSSILENFDEAYDGATDNLLSRKRNNEAGETFSYDNLDRLVSVKNGATETMKINYAPNGNILFKTGVGNFSYDKDVRPHAVTEVDNSSGEIPGDALNTSFNDFGKIEMIEDAGKSLRMDLGYGPDCERWYSELSKNGTDSRTTVYAGEYEKVTENGITREFYYLDGNTIVIKEDGIAKTYLAFTDNLGSILSVMDENGTR